MRDEELTMSRETWTITPGRVVIGSEPQLVLRGRNVRVYEVDLSSKYAEVISTGGWRGQHMVMLDGNEDTLYLDESVDNVTLVNFTLPRTRVGGWVGDWTMLAHCSRYTLYVAFYRRSLWARLDLVYRLRLAWYRLRHTRRRDADA
jgi:hypothetical protein